MRKIKILILITLMMVLLSSCAAENPYTEEVTIYGDLTYDFITMTYTNTSLDDILYRTGNPYDDFVILHENVLQKSLTENEKLLLEALLVKLTLLSELTGNHMISIMDYSSTALKDAFDNHQMILTIDDIVSFNALKAALDEIKTTLDTYDSVIPKIAYIEKRLTVELTSLEINDLELLQDTYREFYMVNHSFTLYNNTHDAFYIELQNAGFTPQENVQTQLENAYSIITLLIE